MPRRYSAWSIGSCSGRDSMIQNFNYKVVVKKRPISAIFIFAIYRTRSEITFNNISLNFVFLFLIAWNKTYTYIYVDAIMNELFAEWKYADAVFFFLMNFFAPVSMCISVEWEYTYIYVPPRRERIRAIDTMFAFLTNVAISSMRPT